MIPAIEDIEKMGKSIGNNLTGRYHVQLDVKKWNIQQKLRDMKVLFKKMTKGFFIEDELQRSMDRITETMEIVIDIYDRIDSYTDHAHFAKYISNLFSKTFSEIKVDPIFENAIKSLDRLIKSNLVLEQYEKAIKAYKQQHFPFSYQDMIQFNLPENLQLNDTDSVINDVVIIIEDLETKLVEMDSVLTHRDGHLINQKDKSFYVWQNKDLIRKLLKGEETIL